MQIASLQLHKVQLPEVPPCEVTGDSATIVASKGGGGFKEGFGGALQYSWSFGMKPAQNPCVSCVNVRQSDRLFLIVGPACGSAYLFRLTVSRRRTPFRLTVSRRRTGFIASFDSQYACG